MGTRMQMAGHTALSLHLAQSRPQNMVTGRVQVLPPQPAGQGGTWSAVVRHHNDCMDARYLAWARAFALI